MADMSIGMGEEFKVLRERLVEVEAERDRWKEAFRGDQNWAEHLSQKLADVVAERDQLQGLYEAQTSNYTEENNRRAEIEAERDRLREQLTAALEVGDRAADQRDRLREELAEIKEHARRAEGTLTRTWSEDVDERDRLREALTLIRDTDPVDAALDPDRAVRVAREALAQGENDG